MEQELHNIIQSHSLDALKAYVGASTKDINHKNRQGFNALSCSIYYEFNEGVEYLLSLPQVKLEIKDKYSKTALAGACAQNNFKAVTLLIKAGANLNAKDERGRTPLFISNKSPQCFKEILRHNPKIHERDYLGSTVFMHLCFIESNNPEHNNLINELITHGKIEDIKQFQLQAKEQEQNSILKKNKTRQDFYDSLNKSLEHTILKLELDESMIERKIKKSPKI